MFPPSLKVDLHPSAATPSVAWHTLSFDFARPYEMLSQQFHPLGITINRGMAIRPSNPKFILGDRRPVLMPAYDHQGLTLHLTQPLLQMQIWVMGSQRIAMVALNKTGHCVATGQTRDLPSLPREAPLTQQMLGIQTRGVARICINSAAPFVVTQLRIQRSQQPVSHH